MSFTEEFEQLSDEETPEEEPFEPSIEEETSEETESETGPPASEDETGDDGGVDIAPGLRLSRAQSDQLANLYRALQADPRQVAAAMAQQYLGPMGYELVQRQQTEQPQQQFEDDDFIDPRTRQLWEKVQYLEHQTAQRAVAEARAYHQEGMSRFSKRHPDLSTEELRSVDAEAARLGLVYATAQGNHPIAATEEALERAYRQIPEYWQREVDKHQASQSSARKRQRRWSGVAGTDGSIPREKSQPKTQTDRDAAMVDMLKAAWGQPDYVPET